MTSDEHRKYNLVTGLVNKHGGAIVKGLMRASAGEIQTYMVPDVADVIWELLNQYRQVT